MDLSDYESLETIAQILKSSLAKAPTLTSDGKVIYQIKLYSKELDQPLIIEIRPSEKRVDARLGWGHTTWTLNGVTEVEFLGAKGSPLEGGLMAISRHTADGEVLFQRKNPPAYLLVSSQGRVSLVT